jgi:hypothetical protein
VAAGAHTKKCAGATRRAALLPTIACIGPSLQTRDPSLKPARDRAFILDEVRRNPRRNGLLSQVSTSVIERRPVNDHAQQSPTPKQFPIADSVIAQMAEIGQIDVGRYAELATH